MAYAIARPESRFGIRIFVGENSGKETVEK